MIIHKEKYNVCATFDQETRESVEYEVVIQILDKGKLPIIMKLKHIEPGPSFAPIPPEKHAIKAPNIMELYFKMRRWFSKYGYTAKFIPED